MRAERIALALGMMSLVFALECLPTQSSMACICPACTVDRDWSMIEPRRAQLLHQRLSAFHGSRTVN